MRLQRQPSWEREELWRLEKRSFSLSQITSLLLSVSIFPLCISFLCYFLPLLVTHLVFFSFLNLFSLAFSLFSPPSCSREAERPAHRRPCDPINHFNMLISGIYFILQKITLRIPLHCLPRGSSLRDWVCVWERERLSGWTYACDCVCVCV